MSWSDAMVSVNLTQQAVQEAPPYEPKLPLRREQKIRLYTHHGRAGYWAEGASVGYRTDAPICRGRP